MKELISFLRAMQISWPQRSVLIIFAVYMITGSIARADQSNFREALWLWPAFPGLIALLFSLKRNVKDK